MECYSAAINSFYEIIRSAHLPPAEEEALRQPLVQFQETPSEDQHPTRFLELAKRTQGAIHCTFERSLDELKTTLGHHPERRSELTARISSIEVQSRASREFFANVLDTVRRTQPPVLALMHEMGTAKERIRSLRESLTDSKATIEELRTKTKKAKSHDHKKYEELKAKKHKKKGDHGLLHLQLDGISRAYETYARQKTEQEQGAFHSLPTYTRCRENAQLVQAQQESLALQNEIERCQTVEAAATAPLFALNRSLEQQRRLLSQQLEDEIRQAATQQVLQEGALREKETLLREQGEVLNQMKQELRQAREEAARAVEESLARNAALTQELETALARNTTELQVREMRIHDLEVELESKTTRLVQVEGDLHQRIETAQKSAVEKEQERQVAQARVTELEAQLAEETLIVGRVRRDMARLKALHHELHILHEGSFLERQTKKRT